MELIAVLLAGLAIGVFVGWVAGRSTLREGFSALRLLRSAPNLHGYGIPLDRFRHYIEQPPVIWGDEDAPPSPSRR